MIIVILTVRITVPGTITVLTIIVTDCSSGRGSQFYLKILLVGRTGTFASSSVWYDCQKPAPRYCLSLRMGRCRVNRFEFRPSRQFYTNRSTSHPDLIPPVQVHPPYAKLAFAGTNARAGAGDQRASRLR